MKDLIFDMLKHDTSFGQSLNTREKFELLLHVGARKRNVERAKSAAVSAAEIFKRGKEMHKRKIEAMLD